MTPGGLERDRLSAPLEIRVLRLNPCPCSTTHVSGADALRDDAFEVHPARVSEDRRAVAGDRLTELNAVAHRLVLAG